MAFCVKVPQEIIKASNEYAKSNNLGNRQDGTDGTKEQQIVGIIGQNMINLLLGRPMMRNEEGFDGGIDCKIFGLSFDIKTMGRSVEPKIDFVNNLIACQTIFNPDAYLFLSLNKTNNLLSICGWLPKKELMNKAKLYVAGMMRTRNDKSQFPMKANTYEISNSNLRHKSKSWTELMQEILCYSHETHSP